MTNKFRLGTSFVVVVVLLFVLVSPAVQAQTKGQSGDKQMMLAHMVFFTLKDHSQAARTELVDACYKYLKDHPGVVYFSAGVRVEELAREVNDRDFDVSLHVVFSTKADHDRYQDAPKHKQFIQENQAGWAKVRVFDSHVK